MKRFSEQLRKKSQTIRLSAAEKRAMRERLMSYMEYHPLPAAVSKSKEGPTPVVETAPFRIISIPAHFLKLSFGVLAAFVLVVLPTLAEKSIPGDILYPVKVQVTEEIRSTLNLSSYEKVAWETERIERRLAEARLLAKEGRLTPEAEAGVVAAVKEHTAAAEKNIADLMETDAEGAGLAQMTFATVLDVQSAVLRSDRLDEEDMLTAAATSGVQSANEKLVDVLEEGKMMAFGKGELAPVSFNRLMAQLELETTRLHELLRTISKNATVEERQAIKRRLEDIERKINEAAGRHGSEPEDATASLRSVWRDTQKLVSFMTDIDVRNSVSVESLVPVVLTFEERSKIAADQRALLLADVERIETGLNIMEDIDDDTLEKIEDTLKIVNDSLDQTSTIEPETINEGERLLAEAEEFITSILALADFPVLIEDDVDMENPTSTEPVSDPDIATSSATTSASTTLEISTTTATTTTPATATGSPTDV